MQEESHDDLLGKIKADLAELVSFQDIKKTPEYSLKLMESVFCEMELAFKSGATQRQVFDVFAKNNVYLPFTRFAQNLIRLRGYLSMSEFEMQVEPRDSQLISHQMLALRDELIPKPKDDANAARSYPAGQAPDSAKKPGMSKAPSSKSKLPFPDRVLACSKIVTSLGTDHSFGLDVASAQAKSILGAGWTPQSVVQFVSSIKFGEWCLVPWPESVDRSQLLNSHRAACLLVSGKEKLPQQSEFKEALQQAFAMVHSNNHQI